MSDLKQLFERHAKKKRTCSGIIYHSLFPNMLFEDFESAVAEMKKEEDAKLLGKIRTWVQWNFHNGHTVTWGSNQELRPPATIGKLEELADYLKKGE